MFYRKENHMMHPDTIIKPVNDCIGNGVFATKLIPKGTIVVVNDRFDITIPREEFRRLPEPLKSQVETYLYHDRSGNMVLGWDHAKYMNHNCDSNTKLTAYDIEVAVRDIQAGEEVTTEYGLLNIQEPYAIHCCCENCRQYLRLDDIDRYADIWDSQIEESLQVMCEIPQPLWNLVGRETKINLESLQKHPESYRSVRNMKWRMRED